MVTLVAEIARLSPGVGQHPLWDNAIAMVVTIQIRNHSHWRHESASPGTCDNGSDA